MQTLKEILDSALVEAKFDIGKVDMPGVSTTYSQDPMEVVSSCYGWGRTNITH